MQVKFALPEHVCLSILLCMIVLLKNQSKEPAASNWDMLWILRQSRDLKLVENRWKEYLATYKKVWNRALLLRQVEKDMETKDSLLSLLFLLTSVMTWLLLRNKYLAPCSVSSSLTMSTKSSLGQTTINTVWVRESSVKIYNKLSTS